jgi:hypothetical protein
MIQCIGQGHRPKKRRRSCDLAQPDRFLEPGQVVLDVADVGVTGEPDVG